MQLKEFRLISPVIKATDVFTAIETVIPLETIEQTIGNTEALLRAQAQAAISTSSLFGNCDELVVK